MKLNQKNIFLLDGIGAVFSSTSTGLILPQFFEWIGLSAMTLRLLGLIGFVFAVYSLTCFSLVKNPKPSMLLTIVFANFLYCVLVLSIALLSSELSTLGKAYFFGEVAIIAGLIFLETRVYRNSFGLRRKKLESL